MKNKKIAALVVSIFIILMFNTPVTVNARKGVIHVYEGERIQAAIDAANSGDTIVVHVGTYQEMVTVSKSLTLIGSEATIETSGPYGFDVQAPATILGFKIKPSADNPLPTVGIQFESTTYYGGSVAGNVVSGFLYGIWVNCPGVSVNNNKIQSSVAGVTFWEVSDDTVIGNSISSGGDGIYVRGGDDVVISSNVVNAVNRGIAFGPGSNGIITKNTVNIDNANVGVGIGITIAQVTCCVASNNVVNGGGDGFHMYTCDEVVIKNNIITAKAIVGGSNGIYLNDIVSNSYFAGNFISGDYAVGIAVGQFATANYIQRNTIAISGPFHWYGIILGTDTSGNYVSGNRITGATTAIVDLGQNTIIP